MGRDSTVSKKIKTFHPEETGPGMWYLIHVSAKEATTEDKKLEFVNLINLIKAKHHCKTCREHIVKFLEDHPIEKFWNVTSSSGEEIGCSLWAFIFHNAVNSRLGKKELDWETVAEMYSVSIEAPCTVGCDKKKKDKPKFIRRTRF